jgi:hypothetical protein
MRSKEELPTYLYSYQTMPLKLKPISFPNDRASIASIITLANFTDPYGQIVWPDSAIPWRIAGSYARLPGTVLSPGAMFMKVVEANGEKEDEEEEIVAYAQWTFPASLWAKMGGRERFSEINEETREQFRREKADSCGADGNPLGMRVEVVEACSPAMEVAGRECFPQEEEFIGSFLFVVSFSLSRSQERWLILCDG